MNVIIILTVKELEIDRLRIDGHILANSFGHPPDAGSPAVVLIGELLGEVRRDESAEGVADDQAAPGRAELRREETA